MDAVSGQTAVPAALALSILLRGAALLLVAGAVALAARRAPAAVRYHVWALAMAGLLALPVLTAALPEWRIAAPEALTAVVASSREAANGAEAGSIEKGGVPWPRGGVSAAGVDAGTGLPASMSVPATVTGTSHEIERASSVPIPTIVLFVWLIGMALLAGRLGLGLWRARRLVRRGRPVTDRQWTILVSLLSLKAGLRRDVRVVVSDEVRVPMAWGLFGSWLILPRGIEDWPEDRRRVVVLHELAHLRRNDCLAQALSELALAVHWPNPLAWIAARRMRSHRERACDDAVIAAGTEGADYAHHLVEVARGLSRGARPLRAAVAMARSSELEGRVLAILDHRRSRRSLGRRSALAGTALLAAMVVPLAALEPAPPPDADTAEAEMAPLAEAEPRQLDLVEGRTTDRDANTSTKRSTNEGIELDSEAGEAGGTVSLEMSGGADVDDPAAALAADTIDSRVFEALMKAMSSDDASLRRKAAHTLGSIENSRGVEALSRAVRSDTDAGVRKEAAWALGMIEDPAAVPALGEAVLDESVAVRRQAAWALGMIESPDAVEALSPLLRDSDADLRKQAVWALGMIESSSAVDGLLPLLRDESPAVRDQTAWALGMIESSAAVSGLAAAFAQENVADVRKQIVWALGMIEDREGLDTVVDAVEDPDAEVRDKAMWALGMILN
ncbi:MAG: HEAT repeat domain-containing protein [Gemmatimonadota bacterium]